MKKNEQAPERDLYALLHLSPDASAEEIRKAYRQWAQIYHPDKYQAPQMKDIATENFQRIRDAYEILSDENKRQIFDIYGMEGLNLGLELGPRLKKPEEIKEELERLQRRKEEEKVFAHARPTGSIIANFSLPRDLSGRGIMKGNLLKSLKRHKDEDALKGQAVKNQKVLWDRTLELRFLLQKAFSSSNRLPQEPIRSLFHNSDTVVNQAYSDLILSSKQTLNCMLELQEALIEQNPLIVQGTDGNCKESCKDEDCSNNLKEEEDEEWLQIHRMHQRIAQFRNNSVDKWQRKTQVTTGAAAFKGKLHAFNQNISEQVAGYMRDPSRMIKRMKLRRSSVGMFGKVPEEFESRKEEDGNVDGDPELLDDSEFYQQLLKEFLESCNLASSETTFYALKRLQPKKRKVVDRRASKSRKIRYNVHEKIVNFMAPVPMVLPPMAPKLFENLFGMGNQKSANVV